MFHVSEIVCTMYTVHRSRHQNAGKNHIVQIDNRPFENVAQFKYFGKTATNRNLVYEKIQRRLNSGNACYHSVQNLLSSCLLPKNIKIIIYETIILLWFYIGVKLCL
jgi:hypothetical protein